MLLAEGGPLADRQLLGLKLLKADSGEQRITIDSIGDPT